jgi:hypothetical protein
MDIGIEFGYDKWHGGIVFHPRDKPLPFYGKK